MLNAFYRNFNPPPHSNKSTVVVQGEIKVCMRTYKLFFVSGNEDFLQRILTPDEIVDASTRLCTRTAMWLKKRRRGRFLEMLGCQPMYLPYSVPTS